MELANELLRWITQQWPTLTTLGVLVGVWYQVERILASKAERDKLQAERKKLQLEQRKLELEVRGLASARQQQVEMIRVAEAGDVELALRETLLVKGKSFAVGEYFQELGFTWELHPPEPRPGGVVREEAPRGRERPQKEPSTRVGHLEEDSRKEQKEESSEGHDEDKKGKRGRHTSYASLAEDRQYRPMRVPSKLPDGYPRQRPEPSNLEERRRMLLDDIVVFDEVLRRLRA